MSKRKRIFHLQPQNSITFRFLSESQGYGKKRNIFRSSELKLVKSPRVRGRLTSLMIKEDGDSTIYFAWHLYFVNLFFREP